MVSTLNLDKLYDLCCVKQNVVENINALFSENLVDVYNNVELGFMVKDISIYEAFILKEFATSTSRLANKHFLYKKYMPMDTPNEIKKYSELLESISDDKGIHDNIRNTYPYFYGPAFLVQGDMMCKFTGSDLYKFFDKNPVDFFLKVTGGLCATQSDKPDENGNIGILFKSDYKLDNLKISKHLQSMFTTKFYAYLNKRVVFADLITDSVSYKYFTNHDKLFKFASIRNPYLEINMKTSSKDDYNKDVMAYRTKLPKEFRADMLSMTVLDAEIYSNFSTFLELFERLPKYMFIMKEDLKIPFKFKEIYIPEVFEPYYDKLEDKYTKLQSYIESITNPMAMYQYTYLNSKFAYTISIKMEDINLYINPLLKDKGLMPETIKVLNQLLKTAQAIYQIL